MRKFYQNKLWREKLIAIREAKGAIVHTVPLSHAEFNEELNIKLLEEANELYEADTHEKMIHEIVGVLEVLDCIINFHGISKEEIIKFKETSVEQLGTYTDKSFVDFVEYPKGSKEEQHCLDNSDKYPELCDENHESINSCCK
jgi:predicted house-cleaning noncanonical NTP pyrophosphatase (MazG superfamily)